MGAPFFADEDYRAYLELISAAARRSRTQIWAYCLMPNHVHFVMTPSDPDGLRTPSPKPIAATPAGSTRD